MHLQLIFSNLQQKYSIYLPRLNMALSLFLGISLIYLAFLKPLVWGSDGNENLQVARSLVLGHGFSLPPNLEADIPSSPVRYPLLPIVLTPFVAVGLGLSQWLNLPEIPVISTCALISSVLLTAATASLVALLTVRLGGNQTGAYISALCFAFGTVAMTYAQTLFSEPLLALLTIACLYGAFDQVRSAWFRASLLSGLAILAKPTGIVIGPLLSVYWFVKRRPLTIVMGPILAPGVGVLLYLAYNYLRFGNPFVTGQPVSQGLSLFIRPEIFFGLLFSPGRGGGLLWYCPPIALATIGFYKGLRSKPLETITLGGVFLGYLTIYSLWWCCGWDWGPRFLVPVIPLLMATTGLLDHRARKWLIGLSIIGFLINAPTLISFYSRYYWELLSLGQNAPDTNLWVPLADAPIVRVWGATFRQISDAIVTNPAELLATTEAETPVAMRILPVWWWLLPAIGVPLWIGVMLAASLIAAGLIILRRGWFNITHMRPHQNRSDQLSLGSEPDIL